MKAITLLVLLIALPASALSFEVCRGDNCYTLTIPDARSWQWIKAYDGRKFVRVYGASITDIWGGDISVKQLK